MTRSTPDAIEVVSGKNQAAIATDYGDVPSRYYVSCIPIEKEEENY